MFGTSCSDSSLGRPCEQWGLGLGVTVWAVEEQGSVKGKWRTRNNYLHVGIDKKHYWAESVPGAGGGLEPLWEC